LGGVDGGGVAETGRGSHIIARQPDGQLAARVSHSQVTVFADAADHPAVPVFHPIGGGEAEPAVVAAGDDHISDTRLIAVAQRHLDCHSGVVETMLPGAAVEISDEIAGRSDHDRVESNGSVGNPSGEGIIGDLGEIADMNTAVIKIELECLRFAFSEGERCCCLSRVGVAVQLGQMECAVAVLDVAEDAAGADRGELLIITDQADACAAVDGELDCGVEGQGVGHAGFVDDDQCRRSDRRCPIRKVVHDQGTR
jgi:hypothetical protein